VRAREACSTLNRIINEVMTIKYSAKAKVVMHQREISLRTRRHDDRFFLTGAMCVNATERW
jgi:hypothetical protein